MMGRVLVTVHARAPLFIEADPDQFGQVFAAMPSDEQVSVLRAMVEHMKPHRTQWDFISIELEEPENAELRSTLREVLFPEVQS